MKKLVKVSNMNSTPKNYAILRRWKDNPDNFDVIEYASSEEEAMTLIDTLPKSELYRYEVGKYE